MQNSNNNNNNNRNSGEDSFELEMNCIDQSTTSDQMTVNSSPSLVAVVPEIQIIDLTSGNSVNIKKQRQQKSAIGSAGSIDVYSMRDVSSTTDLIALEDESESNSESIKFSFSTKPNGTSNTLNSSINGKIKANKTKKQPSKNTTLLIQSAFNSQSQSSIDANSVYVKDGDSIPLVRLTHGDEGRDNLTEPLKHHIAEKWYVILLEVLFPFLIAGFGMVCAGVVLDIVQHWELFVVIPAIFTLIPALLGLKGNLEMTLASRFSTQVNIGLIKDRSTIFNAIMGNIALTQAQSIIVGFLASFGALLLKLITDKTWDLNNSLVIVTGSMSTASFASMILGGLMMLVILISKKMHINPDNIATPIAASLGDLVTLTILSFLCTFLYQIKSLIWIHIITLVVYIVLVPIFIYYSSKNEFVKDALFNGWTPIIVAMVISSSGGFIMSFAVQIYKDIAVFQPVVNGVGGNLVAIFASRLSTAFFRTSTQGTVPSWKPAHWYLYPWDTFFAKHNPESKTAIVLAGLSIPGHLLFFFTITRIKALQSDPINPACLTASFILFYMFLLILQVLLLLLICYWLVHYVWRLNKNPDNVCIPYLTAIGDFLGTSFLAICFHVLYLAGNTGLRNPH